ncbi:MAG TPA: carboxypeptidase regulatory-like domain-containing protein [Candidatus Acidoferrum sp.]|nr:carboxypeptidase regulatory-like domain-containing protein [Candidatus Acidoferrum sp.]
MKRALAIARILLLVAISAAAANTTQPPKNQAATSATLQGTIRDGAGTPISDAAVLLEEKGSAKVVRTKSDARGEYSFTVEPAGSYTIRAEKAGWLATVVDTISLTAGETKQLDLVLTPEKNLQIKSDSSGESTKTPADGMELKDEPSFQVAGVTDWSDLGLHGSARSSKTSESLAKETKELKPESGTVSSSGAENRYNAALDYRNKGEYTKAREEVRKQLAARDDADGHRLLGDLEERLGNPLEAVHEYETAARMEPSEENYFDWGTELLVHKAAKPAAEVFARGASAHPKSARLLTGLGAALYAGGSPQDAARRLCEATELQPDNATPYIFLGKMEASTSEELPCSEEKLEQFAQAHPGDATANFYYAISVEKAAEASGNASGLRRAETLFGRVLTIDPKFGEAALQLGLLHAANGNGEQALRDFQDATQASPELAEAHRQLGLAYQRGGEAAKARAEFTEYERLTKAEAAETEREQKEMRQFVISLKGQKETPAKPN